MNHSLPSEPKSFGELELETVLTEQEYARVVKRSVASVRRDRLLRQGCPYVKLGALVRYRVADIKAGIEHHHQEGKGNEKEGKRTEAEGTEGASAFSPESSAKAPGKNPSHIRPDDEEKPGTVYASPENELKAIYLAKAREPITIELLTVIRADLEATRVSFGEYLVEVRKHIGNDWRNPAGFLRSLSKRFRSKTRPASDPITATQEQEKNYRCPLCFSVVRGEGVRLVGNKIEVCECATAEYAAQYNARASLKAQAPR